MLLRQRVQQSSQNYFSLPPTNVSQSRDRITFNVELHGGVLTLTNEILWIGIYYSRNDMEPYLAILKIVRQALEKVIACLKNVLGAQQISFPSFLCTECNDHPVHKLAFILIIHYL